MRALARSVPPVVWTVQNCRDSRLASVDRKKMRERNAGLVSFRDVGMKTGSHNEMRHFEDISARAATFFFHPGHVVCLVMLRALHPCTASTDLPDVPRMRQLYFLSFFV